MAVSTSTPAMRLTGWPAAQFTFRFNRRTSRARGLLFYRLLQQAAGTDATAQGADRSRDVVELVETL